jgi:hypothetical protein
MGLAIADEQMLTAMPGGHQRQAELPDQRQHPILSGADPLTAGIDGDASDLHRMQSPATPLAGFEHLHPQAGLLQQLGSAHAGHASADDDDVQHVC